MIAFHDFEPRVLDPGGIFRRARVESLAAVMADLNTWIADQDVDAISIETVVLPHIHDRDEEGSTDPELGTKTGSTWYPCFRVWYRQQ